MTLVADTVDSRILADTDKQPIEAATSLIPIPRTRHAETDALGRLPDSTVADLKKARLLDMVVPRMYGGLQSSLTTFMDTVVELGKGDGAVAWTVALLGTSTWIASTAFPKHVTDEIFSEGPCTQRVFLAPIRLRQNVWMAGY